MFTWHDMLADVRRALARLLVVVIVAVAGAIVDGQLLDGQVGEQGAALLGSLSKSSAVRAELLPLRYNSV